MDKDRLSQIRRHYNFYKTDKKMRKTFSLFLKQEATGGILLFTATIVALIFANYPHLGNLNDFWEKDFSISFNTFVLKMSLHHWINDGLMAIFFFVVGLEIKRELMVGELSDIKQASLPIAAAIGGMLFPALMYLLINANSPETIKGWGVPMATDIAFAIGVLSLLGKRVPISVKVFLTALAIADDLGAIVVIAIFYPTHELHINMLLYAGIIMIIIATLNRLQIRHTFLYVIAGIALWFLILTSGVHATIAGVLLAIVIPARTRISGYKFYKKATNITEKFKESHIKNETLLANQESRDAIKAMQFEISRVSSPMQKFETGLHSLAMYVIMPLFALTNAGVVIDFSAMSDIFTNISLGIIVGLVVGKPVGIFILSFIMIKLKLAKFPDEMDWKLLLSAGMIAGIGFTMSMFMSNLAFADPNDINISKIAIFTASIISGILGSSTILSINKKKQLKNETIKR